MENWIIIGRTKSLVELLIDERNWVTIEENAVRIVTELIVQKGAIAIVTTNQEAKG